MSKIFKHIIKISLFIAGLAIITHSIIPHDHHYNFTSDIDHHNNNGNSNNEPIHCHILNNIENINAKTNSFINIFKTLPVLFTNTTIIFSDTNINYQANKLIEKDDNLQDNCVLISISPTRGSPLV